MILSKQYFLRKSDIFILRYNSKSLFRCFGFSTTDGYEILGGLLLTQASYHNIVKFVFSAVKLAIIWHFIWGNKRQPAVIDD